MSCFLLPKKTCNEININQRKFWWGSEDVKKKINWISWDKLRSSKREGGLGFRELQDVNIALLAKQAWRLVQSPDSLRACFLKSIYYPGSDFLNSKPRNESS